MKKISLKTRFRKDMSGVWAEMEKKWGKPLPQGFRDRLEKDWEPPDVNPNNEEEVQNALSDFKCLIMEELEKVELATKEWVLEYFDSRKKRKGLAAGERSQRYEKRSQRYSEKRLYLVEFVMNRYSSTIANWIGKSIYGETIHLRKRIDWEQMVAAWNEAHPHNHMSKGYLMNRYYHAIAEEDIQREYIKRRFIRIDPISCLSHPPKLYDLVKVIDSKGNEKKGRVSSINFHFKDGKPTTDIRLMGDELPIERTKPWEKINQKEKEDSELLEVIKGKGGVPKNKDSETVETFWKSIRDEWINRHPGAQHIPEAYRMWYARLIEEGKV